MRRQTALLRRSLFQQLNLLLFPAAADHSGFGVDECIYSAGVRSYASLNVLLEVLTCLLVELLTYGVMELLSYGVMELLVFAHLGRGSERDF